MKRTNLSLGLLFFAGVLFAQPSGDQIYSLTEFAGGVDVVTYTKLADKFAPFDGILNVWTDEYAMITKRLGYAKYNTTALTGAQKARNMFVYDKDNGSSYIIVNSSWSCFYSIGDGNFTSIVDSLDDGYRDDYCVGGGDLIRDNGYSGLGGDWDDTTYTAWTVANTTSMVTGRYVEYWHNRLWKAGITDYRNTLFYSELNDPKNFSTDAFNYIYVNVNDGDLITDLFRWGDRLLVFKKRSTWEIIETSAGNFIIRCLSNKIGCLYNTTVDELNGYPVFLSYRGVERYDGTNFELISQPIDNFIKGLSQLDIGQTVWTQTDSEDWGAGADFVNVDTTTYSGDVSLITGNIFMSESQTNTSYILNVNSITVTQSFYCNYDLLISSIVIYGYDSSDVCDVDIICDIRESSFTSVALTSCTIDNDDFPRGGSGDAIWVTGYLNAYQLEAETTYYLVVYSSAYPILFDSTYEESDIFLKYEDGYSRGDLIAEYRGSVITGNSKDLSFKIYGSSITLGSFTSQSYEAISWGSWGNFFVSETEPTGSTIDYYIRTSTASDILDTKDGVSVIHGSSIDSTVGPFIDVIASFTVTNAENIPIPKLSEFKITYYGTNQDVPFGIVYEDRYFLAVSSDDTETTNDCLLVYQKDGTWTRFTGDFGAGCVYRNKLYLGDGTNTGYVYEMFKDNVYDDNGSAYDAYWTSKVIDFGYPLNEKIIKTVWVTADNSGSWDLDVKYRLDGSTGSWTSKSIDVYDAYGPIVEKIGLGHSQRSRFIQLRVGNNNADEYFGIRRLDLIHTIERLR